VWCGRGSGTIFVMRLTTVSRVLVVLLVVATGGCQWPRDAEGTLDRVRGGTLRVGVAVSPPWTTTDGGTVGGAEVVLVQRLADQLGAEVDWVPGGESELMAALSERAVDLVVAGLDADAPWEQDAALTADYLTTDMVVAVPDGVGPGVAGARVAVEAGSAEVELLADEDAIPVLVDAVPARPEGPVVVPDWWVEEAGLTDTGVHLSSSDHVMAVPLGENGWQTTVEEFLLSLDEDEVRRLLVDARRAEG
jgi:polar amino acid transport system substrate-binding protein